MNRSDFMIREGIQGSGVFTQKAYAKGEVVLKMKGEVVESPTRTSIQIGSRRHIEDEIGSHVNHNCHPNVYVDRDSASLVSLRDIKVGEEITFDYRANEDSLANVFVCQCCGKLMTGKLSTEAEITIPPKKKSPMPR